MIDYKIENPASNFATIYNSKLSATYKFIYYRSLRVPNRHIPYGRSELPKYNPAKLGRGRNLLYCNISISESQFFFC
jgi:hypothetical protein